MAFDFIAFGNSIRLFDAILPFVLVFVIVYGILGRIKVFENNRLNGMISIVIGLMALNINFSGDCIGELFKFLFISLAIILVFYIMLGLFIDDKNKFTKYLILLILLIFGWIFISKSEECVLSFPLPVGLDNWPWILGTLIFLGILWLIIRNPESPGPRRGAPPRREEPRDDREGPPRREEPDEDLQEHLEEITPGDRRRIRETEGPETSS